MLCSRCKKRPAVVFMTTMDGNSPQKNQGLCLVCAKELGIGPVNEMIKQMGLDDEQIEAISEQMTEMLGEDGEGLHELFEAGGAQTFPFENLMSSDKSEDNDTDKKEGKSAKEDKKKKSKFKKMNQLIGHHWGLTNKSKLSEVAKGALYSS